MNPYKEAQQKFLDKSFTDKFTIGKKYKDNSGKIWEVQEDYSQSKEVRIVNGSGTTVKDLTYDDFKKDYQYFSDAQQKFSDKSFKDSQDYELAYEQYHEELGFSRKQFEKAVEENGYEYVAYYLKRYEENRG